MKEKMGDVSVAFGFNTARENQDEYITVNGQKVKKGKSGKLSLDDPEKIDKAVEKILNSSK